MDAVEVAETALTAIKTNKVRSFLTTLGIVIGVAAVILLVSIGQGLQAFVTSQFESLGANLLIVVPGKVDIRQGPGRPVAIESKFSFDDVRQLRNLGGAIMDTSAIVYKSATVSYKQEAVGVQVNGVEANFTKIRNMDVKTGSFITQNMVEREARDVVIGAKLAEDLFGQREAVGKEIEVSGQSFKVVGVMQAVGGGGLGSASDFDRFAFLPMTTAVKAFGSKSPTAIYVMARSAEKVAEASRQVERYFKRKDLGEDDFTLLKPEEILETIKTFLATITAALSGIAAISLLVGGIGIANIMLVSVTERTREIGLRKAVGATKRDILVQFLTEAVVLSFFGGVIGVAIGGGFSLVLRRVIETEVTAGAVTMAFGVSALVGVVAGLAPAMRAASKSPIEALRYE